MLYAVVAGFIFAIFFPAAVRINKQAGKIAAAVLPLGIFIYFASFYNTITEGNVIAQSYNWIPSLGINLSFYLDGLSLTFALIISLVGFAVFLYTASYMEGNKYITRFYIYITLFMASMLGLVLSDNIITMFVFWELTSISSYFLIGFNHDKERSRIYALQALLITGGGGLALLAGLIIIANISGGWSISSLADLNELITGHKHYPIAAILVLIGAFTKSAQFPFHFWLPNAMEAPTPVSAYLHSATMVKAGIYLMARMNPSLGGTDLWQHTILIVGAVTMLFTAMLSLKQTDLKKLLAYSTLGVLGTLTMLLGIGSDLAIKAFMIYLIAHSLYKGTLFLIAGIIDHETGTRDITKLGGLRKLMPITMVIAVLASLSKMGIIPLIGFVGKETVYASALEFEPFGTLLIILAIAANVFIVYITIAVGFKPFFGKLKPTPKEPHESPFKMWFGPMILALLGVVLGMFSSVVINSLINFTEIGVINKKLNIPVKLWHGFNLELALSVLTVLLGVLLYFKRDNIVNTLNKISFTKYVKPSYYYEFLLSSTLSFAKFQTKFLQNGNLSNYAAMIIVATIFLGGLALVSFGGAPNIDLTFAPTFAEVIIGIILILAAISAVRAKSRLTAIVSVGVVGYSVALIFIMYSAPDLAMTQFAIETLTVILFVLVIYRLPKYLPFSSMTRRIRDFILAGLGGLLMSLIVLFIIAEPMTSELKKYFGENSLTIGKGRNIVNVILVDFRALDTMGEIAVLAIAAIGVYALLKLKSNGSEK
ncbi:MAG: putative monovalent cation/H+ antiporter subunit A [Ignavibacteriae bacterium]|nr:putative monovalent cation/H+ antiporter subunit A [Ignavibacteriota bacterium]NOG97859.1 putative monovalent cation/H+ antiporter subunit A [Ignavibacteriota bacterium]